ncbi:bacillithiol biosynthesis deacetylase BshB2 [Mangrovibacillus cuniculi]|uniref:Bacillithiol biosynthesis deacetylase BshB2 n=1 Tax=Mangrovibacillus cuniculi TaxID=2593652 RepID=A0A7S8CD35_9BACI|nr:bacillithiol biosynthesis deacetylase BshB2 [Mangrovibacillus cuniculi]QPC47774.1 bacillithiol biosynthesis deacetylase BshB2 [Mangrovibacillus cuniculi]
MNIQEQKSVLVIFPHPDDEAFGVSGTIGTFTGRGTPLTYACLTLGQMGRNMGNPPFTTREELPKIRQKELLDAAKVMGIQDLRMMGFRDKTLEFEDDQKMADMVTTLINDVKPSLIISFYPGYAVHPDHEATARAVVRAMRAIPASERPTLYGVAFANNTSQKLGAPHVLHDVSTMREVKLSAMRAHASQTVWMLADLEKRLQAGDPEAKAWVETERFYIYDFDKDTVS